MGLLGKICEELGGVNTMEIDDFKMFRDSISFIVNKEAIGRLVEIKLTDGRHVSKTNICDFDFLSDNEWYELDRLIDVLSDILVCSSW